MRYRASKLSSRATRSASDSFSASEQKRLNRLMAALRSAVEHPFRVLKRQFGYTKVRYRGLFKNEQHLFSQFALVNLYIARRVITPAG